MAALHCAPDVERGLQADSVGTLHWALPPIIFLIELLAAAYFVTRAAFAHTAS